MSEPKKTSSKPRRPEKTSAKREPGETRQVARARVRSYRSRLKGFDDPTDDPFFLEKIRKLAANGEMVMIDNLILTTDAIVAVEPEDMPTWAHDNLWVPPGTGGREGPLKLSAMQSATARLIQTGIKRLTYLKGPRIGFSFLIATIMAYYACHENDAVMMYDRSLAAAKTFCEDKFTRIFQASEKVAWLLPEEKASSGRQRWDNRTTVRGAPIKFRSFSNKIKSDDARIILVDEAGDSAMRDKAKKDGTEGKGEGSKVTLISARGAQYGNFCLIMGGTPTNWGECTVSDEHAKSNQCEWVMDLPCCRQEAFFKCDVMEVKKSQAHLPHGPGLRYTTNDKGVCDDVWYECPHCSAKITEQHKVPMLETGRWVPQTEGDPGHWGIYSWMIHSQDPERPWDNIANAHKAAVDFPDAMKAFTNMYLAKPYVPPRLNVLLPHEMADKVVDYGGFEVPEWVEFLFAGIDCQEGEAMRPDQKPPRMEVGIWGIGANMRMAKIAHHVVAWAERTGPDGETVRVNAQPFTDAAVEQVYEILDREYARPDGVLLKVIRTCCDVNWNMEMGTAFCNREGSRRRKIIPVRGANDLAGNLPPIPPTREKGFVYEKTGVLVYSLGTQTAKTHLHFCLGLPSEAPQGVTFPKGTDISWFNSLLAEHQIEMTSGRKVWKPKDKKKETGEVLDCFVYAYAAMLMEREWTIYGRDVMKPTIRVQVEAVEAALDAAVAAKRIEKLDLGKIEAMRAEAPAGPDMGIPISAPEAVQGVSSEMTPLPCEDVSLSSARPVETVSDETPVPEPEVRKPFHILRREEAERRKRQREEAEKPRSILHVVRRGDD